MECGRRDGIIIDDIDDIDDNHDHHECRRDMKRERGVGEPIELYEISSSVHGAVSRSKRMSQIVCMNVCLCMRACVSV